MPLGVAFEVRRKMKEAVVAQLLLAIIRTVPLLIAFAYWQVEFSASVIVYSLSALLGYLIYFLILRSTFRCSSDSLS